MFVSCYDCKWEENELKYIILDDMSFPGFTLKPVQYAYGVEETKLLMNRLARFHAVSYAFKKGDGMHLKNLYGDYIEELYVKQHDFIFGLYKTGLPTSIDKVKAIPGYEEKVLFVEDVLNNLSEFWDECLKPIEPLAALCHGDLWTQNTLWKYEDGLVKDIRFIDLQVLRYGNFSLDISNFLCICSDSVVVREHFDEIMLTYYNEFETALSCLGEKITFSLQDLYDDYSKHGRWGLICAFQWLPMMLTNLDRSTELHNDLERTKHLTLPVLQERLCNLLDVYHNRNFLNKIN